MRIAFCLYGLVGSATEKYGLGADIDYRIGHHLNEKYIFDKNDTIDVFIHSWSTDYEKGLVDVYKPKNYIIEKQIDFKQSSVRQNSIASRWYSLAMVNQLKSLYEEENDFKYDWVMLSRFDYVFNKDLIFKDLDNKYFYNSHILECVGGSCKCDSYGAYSDPWFFGNSSDIDLFSTMYEKWGTYCTTPGVLLHSSHKETLHHIKQTGLKSRLKHIFYDRFDHYPVRCKYINCEYTNEEFDVTNLKSFNNIDDGYGARTHTQDRIIERNNE